MLRAVLLPPFETGMIGLFNRVRDFMQRLAVGISKPQGKNKKAGKSMWLALAASFPKIAKK